jgi:hypothetical protein
MWLRIGASEGFLWSRWWTFGFHKILGCSWVAAWLVVSQKGLSSMMLVTNITYIQFRCMTKSVEVIFILNYWCLLRDMYVYFLLSIRTHSQVHTHTLLCGEVYMVLRPRGLRWWEPMLLLVPPKRSRTKAGSLTNWLQLTSPPGRGWGRGLVTLPLWKQWLFLSFNVEIRMDRRKECFP